MRKLKRGDHWWRMIMWRMRTARPAVAIEVLRHVMVGGFQFARDLPTRLPRFGHG
jgi:hypothetical protein